MSVCPTSLQVELIRAQSDSLLDCKGGVSRHHSVDLFSLFFLMLPFHTPSFDTQHSDHLGLLPGQSCTMRFKEGHTVSLLRV